MPDLRTDRSHGHLPKALTPDELEALRAVPMNLRDHALIATMAGCGLRVSEACDLTLDDVRWSSDSPAVRFTGKRGKERVVPVNLDVQDALRAWLEHRGTGGSSYVFCNLRTGGRLSRKTVWAALKRHATRAGIRHVHPHMLRHTFGTSLADNDVPVERIRELMGHAKIETSKIYITVSIEQKRTAVHCIDRRPGLIRWISRQRNRHYRFLGRPRRSLVFSARQTVGRHAERRRLQENLDRGIDTLLIGSVGVGKTHLLALLKRDRLISVKGLTPIRQTIIDIAEALYREDVFQSQKPDHTSEGGEANLSRACPQQEGTGRPPQPALGEGTPEALGEASAEQHAGGDAPGTQKTDSSGFDAIKRRYLRTSVQGWTQMVLDSVERDEWALVVDDLSGMSVSVGRLLDRLNTKFIIFGALHSVKGAHERHFWKFERIKLENFEPADARKLIRQCAAGAEVEDYRMLETYVLHKSAGNPRAIVELVERLRKEPPITRSAVRDVQHTGARSTMDLTPSLIVVVVILLAARFIARGAGSMDGYIIAGVGSAVIMGLRFFLYRMGK